MKHNKFSKWIERLLVLLPLFYVAISSAYVIFNKNAKDSYSEPQENIEQSITLPNMVTGNVYNFSYDTLSIDSGYLRLYFDYIEVPGLNTTGYDNAYIYLSSSNPTFALYGTGLNTLYVPRNTYTKGSFKYISSQSSNFVSTLTFTEIVYNGTNTLDKVFTYSLSQFNSLGFGKLDFTSWFTNIFMNGNTNNVYVQFVNSYLNYFLLVEVVYFIPMIIYWFIHFGESVIEKFTNKEF